jgi:integrase
MPKPPERPVVDGVELAPNLFEDAQKRPGKFRYRKPDRSFLILKGTHTPQQANAIATACNAKIASGDYSPPTPDPKAPPAKGSWGDLVEQYIAQKERLEPDVLNKDNWQNMRTYLGKFGREFADVAPHRIDRPRLLEWWNELTHYQQNKRHAELRRLFNWAMGERYCPQLEYNPFTLNDDRPRLYLKSKPEKARSALTRRQFWETYHRAGEEGLVGLQRAMAISLVTTMRQGDICKLRFDQVTVNGQLRVVIGKSEAQRGAASATRLAWSLDNIPLLRDVIIEAREGSLAARRCPFIVYHVPLRSRDYHRKTAKAHPFQMMPDLLQKQFKRVRPDVPNPPTFHEIRALSSVLYRQAGHNIDEIRELMAHTDEATTLSYQDHGDLPYKEVTIALTAKDIGGKF